MLGATRTDVLNYAAKKLGTAPEYLFRSSPQTAVLRHGASGKWYAIIMPVRRSVLGLSGAGIVDVVNVKCDPLMLGSFLMQPGFLPAYHMSKANWLSILLDGSVDTAEVTAALHMSYALVSRKSGGKRRTEPREWLVPANPKYENLAETFSRTDEILWKQSARFIVGDTIYIYEGVPIGAVTYSCEVTAVDVPCKYDQGGLHMETAVRAVLRRCYAPEEFPRVRLADLGVTNIRGPRSVPEELSAALRMGGTPVRRQQKNVEILFLEYPKCSTCKKARVWLDTHGIAYTARHIAEQPPTVDELSAWVTKSGLPLRRFFNTSGMRYRELDLAKRLPDMPESEQLSLLASDGMLVKRPLLIAEHRVLVGFREAEWEQLL